jgi:electron transfer flavoprotein beta subunit
MQIIIFVKTVRFIYAQTGTDPTKNFVGPDDVIHIISPFDELAVEEALQIKDKHENTEIVAISLGDHFAEEGLRKCLSMGADKAIRIDYEGYETLDPWLTANVLASSIRNDSFHLILCGKEAIDDNNGLIGPYVAEILGIPYVSRVVAINIEKNSNKVTVHRAVERGDREIWECELPVLLTVERGINIPRYPNLPGILRAQDERIQNLNIEDIFLPVKPSGKSNNLTEVVGLSCPKPQRKTGGLVDVKISAADRLKLLMKGGDSQPKKDTNLVEGGSEKAIYEFKRIMKENGIFSE